MEDTMQVSGISFISNNIYRAADSRLIHQQEGDRYEAEAEKSHDFEEHDAESDDRISGTKLDTIA